MLVKVNSATPSIPLEPTECFREGESSSHEACTEIGEGSTKRLSGERGNV
jgi:hypothetical protein